MASGLAPGRRAAPSHGPPSLGSARQCAGSAMLEQEEREKQWKDRDGPTDRPTDRQTEIYCFNQHTSCQTSHDSKASGTSPR